MANKKPQIIGELMNNSYARARKAWQEQNTGGYQELARLQTELGASFLTLNIDATQKLKVTLDEMLAFLPKVIPAIQDVTALPISFDNPNAAFHREALKHYNPAKANQRPILNSISVSRKQIDELIELVKTHDMNVIVMASECLRPDGSHGAALTALDIVNTTKHFAKMLRAKAGVSNDRIIVDPGLAPVTSDTSGLINLCLDAIRAIRADDDLTGIHISVGLSNFAVGAPKEMRVPLERAFLTLAMEAGMDFALANPEKNTEPYGLDEPLVQNLKRVLESGRPTPGESQDDAGYRQLDEVMALWAENA